MYPLIQQFPSSPVPNNVICQPGQTHPKVLPTVIFSKSPSTCYIDISKRRLLSPCAELSLLLCCPKAATTVLCQVPLYLLLYAVVCWSVPPATPQFRVTIKSLSKIPGRLPAQLGNRKKSCYLLGCIYFANKPLCDINL